MNIVAIVQARMSSSRLPGKVLRDIAGEPMLVRVVERVRRSALVNQVVVATTTDASDDSLEEFCAERGYPCFRGSLHDVLDRYYQAAQAYQADVILRITSDCPVIDPGLMDEMVSAFCAGMEDPAFLPYDFAANRLPPPWQRTFPIGLDMEMCSMAALERAWKEADQKFQREHVMPFFYEGLELAHRAESQMAVDGELAIRTACTSPRGFRVLLLDTEPGHGTLRWTVDTPQDLELVRQIYASFEGQSGFNWRDILDLFARQPDLAQINAGVSAKQVHEIDKRV